jgi:hypothetical protein
LLSVYPVAHAVLSFILSAVYLSIGTYLIPFFVMLAGPLFLVSTGMLTSTSTNED